MASSQGLIDKKRKSTTVWKGLGINASQDEGIELSSAAARLTPNWTRIPLHIPDPGSKAKCMDGVEMDKLWIDFATRISASYRHDRNLIFYGGAVPQSWLTHDRELRGDALIAYARLLVSGTIVLRKVHVPVDWLEVCDNPDLQDLITPDNYVVLTRSYKSLLASRASPPVKLLGPSLSRLIAVDEYAEPFIAALRRDPPDQPFLLDAWSIHVVENEVDLARFNSGTYAARTYVQEQLQRSMRFMKYARPQLPIYVTRFGTVATRFSTGIDYGKGAPETTEHAIRIIDLLCSVVAEGIPFLIPWTTQDRYDNKSLLRKDKYRRPHCDALSHVNRTLPLDGFVYQSSMMAPPVRAAAPSDQTLTLVVIKDNAFGFILSRAQTWDSLAGSYSLDVMNSEWEASMSNTLLPSHTATINLTVFPSYVSLTGTMVNLKVSESGVLHVGFENLPYNCVVFGRGDVYATDVSAMPLSCKT